MNDDTRVGAVAGEADAAGGRDTEASGAGRSAAGSIELDLPRERVWRALTEAAELERWFPLEARVEPGEGGLIHLSWKNEFAGDSEILSWDPPSLLRTTWKWGEGEGEAQVTEYRLEARGGSTFLRVVTSGFPEGAEWDEWVEGTRLGWRFELRSLKHYLERHRGEDRGVLYLRRRVRLSREEAWERLFGPSGVGERPHGATAVDREPPRQYAALVREPRDGLLRLSNEPCGVGGTDAGLIDTTLFLSAWGEAREGLADLEPRWRDRLEELFPEGEWA